MGRLRLRLLGRFEARLDDGAPLRFPMRKAEALLAYLALSPGVARNRDEIVGVLWSDRPDAQARNSLRQALSAVRKTLGVAAGAVIAADRETIGLASDAVEVDAVRLRTLPRRRRERGARARRRALPGRPAGGERRSRCGVR